MGVKQEIVGFEQSDSPLSIAIIFDVSGSMGSGRDLRPSKRTQSALDALIRFVQVGHPTNEYLLIIFNDKPHLLHDPNFEVVRMGTLEAGERMEAALRREIKEELGIEISDIKPLFFKDGLHKKSFADASQLEVYMIFLVFLCRAASDEIKLSPEFSDYAWVSTDTLQDYDLNSATVETFRQAGVLS